MYTSGGSGGLAVAVGRGRDHKSSLKDAPVLTSEIQTLSQGNETVVLQRRYKGRWNTHQVVKQKEDVFRFGFVLFC